jgi:23S rRNA (pseudouridine1915-N3)-methyltransferase
MIRSKIFSIGQNKEPWLKQAILEYEKRLSGKILFEWILVKSRKELAKKIETPFVALDLHGDLIDSNKLSSQISQLVKNNHSRINFLIGDDAGIEKQLIDKASWRWCLSPLTFTHQITRLILLEQIYRSFAIESGSSYHK